MTPDDDARGHDFEQRLRAGLADAAHLAYTSQDPDAIAGRARRRDRVVTAAGIAASLVLVAVVALVVVPDRGRGVVLDGGRSDGAVADDPLDGEVGPGDGLVVEDGIPGPVETATAPGDGIPDPPVPQDLDRQPPEGRLVAAIDGRLVLTDLEGRVEREAAWQPTTTAPIAEVVTDGDMVVTWQPPCTLEAGSLVHGTSISSLASDGSCNGPAAIDAETGLIVWISDAMQSAPDDGPTLAYHQQRESSASGGAVLIPGLFQRDDRVVGIDRAGGVLRLLIRRVGANWIEVMALPLEELPEGGWAPASDPDGGATELVPAYSHLDGYVPLDAADGWVLDVPWDDAEGLDPSISSVRVRPTGGPQSFTESGGMEVDAATVWFDAEGPATIWGHGGDGLPQWDVTADQDGGTTAWSGQTSGGVTAAAIVPGSVVVPPLHTGPPNGTVTEPPTTEGGSPDVAAPDGWAAQWCEDVPMIGIATAADHDEPFALCADGGTPPLVGGGFGWTHPSIAAGAFALAAVGGDGHAPAFTVMGARRLNREGETPALAHSGGIAWTTRSLDATTIHVAESLDLTDSPQTSYELPSDLAVTHLSWARDSRFLFVTTRSDGGETAAWVIDTTVPAGVGGAEVPDPRLTPIGAPAGEQVLAVAGEIETIGAGVLLTVDAGGTARIAGVLVANGTQPYPEPRITTLAEIDGPVAGALTAEGAVPTVTAVGLLTPNADGAWRSGSTIAWLVGDGQLVWHVPADGPPTLYRTGTADIAIDPAVGM